MYQDRTAPSPTARIVPGVPGDPICAGRAVAPATVALAQSSVAPRLSAPALLCALLEPALLIDLRGGVHAANPAADRMLASGDLLGQRHGRLIVLEFASHLRLVRTLRRLSEAAQLADGAASSARATVRLAMPARGMQVALSLCTLPWSAAGGWWPAFVLVRVHDPAQRTEVDRELLCGLYGLTPAEARVAALLVEGHAPKQIAQRSGVTLGTVRAQLKAAFVKTGTCRQADLVRQITSLPRAVRPVEP
jgi:DNA-binding CsgD family transcriptional regulator